MSTTTENDVPREHVIHEREIVTERRRNPIVSFLVALAALAVIALIVVISWAALDDDGSTVDDVQDEIGQTVDEVQQGLGDTGDSIGSEADDIQDDLTDGR